jgi:hypothetical protein
MARSMFACGISRRAHGRWPGAAGVGLGISATFARGEHDLARQLGEEGALFDVRGTTSGA